MRVLRYALLGSLVAMSACDGCDNDPEFGPIGGSDTDTDADGDTDTDTDADTDADTDTDVPFDGFSEPGDYAVVESQDGEIEVELVDVDGESNTEQEFFAILVNTGEMDVGFKASYELGESPSSAPPPVRALSPFRQQLRDWKAERKAAGQAAAPPPPLPELVVGETLHQFHVEDDLSDPTHYELVTGRLAALGDTVAIYVDTDHPIDWDYDCDGVIDLEHQDDAFGFDNCDLDVIAGIVDANIMVNLEALLGEFSDVNGDDRVTVLVTPVLNQLPRTSDDPDDFAAVFESYADPEVDLDEYDEDLNPGSDYQEVIYVFAPDPYGYYNKDFTTTVEAYNGMSLAAQIAAETAHLIVYNQKVLLQESSDEESWLMQGIGAVAADIVGFGAIFFDDAWDYMDAPHLGALTQTSQSDDGGLSLEKRGAQYLFLRYLVDVYGEEILAELVQSSLTSTDNVIAAVAAAGGPSTFEEIVLQWQVALLTTGVQNIAGEPLVDQDVWPPFADAEFIEAPTEPPETSEVGTYYGANGYQRGINIQGRNVYMEGGTTADPAENTSLRVNLSNTDHATFVSGFEFYGNVVGGYGASVMRLIEPTYDATTLLLEPNGDLQGVVIRWNDPIRDDIVVEQIFSSAITNAIALPGVPEDGEPIYGVGEIGGAWQISSIDPEGETSEEDFYDTDLWLLDLQDRGLGSQVRLHIWLDRRYENREGDIGPYDPWLAVVPQEWVPTPNETDTVRARCAHPDGANFAYPINILQYLFNQQVLSHLPFSEGEVETQQGDEEGEGGTTDFDPCGSLPEDTAVEPDCSNDWDSDGVLDADEPAPENFYNQILVSMCSADPELLDADVWGLEWFDRDSLDGDESPTRDRINNTGGAAGASGEEAFLDITLEGGRSYLIVVSGGSDSGTYEFAVREIGG